MCPPEPHLQTGAPSPEHQVKDSPIRETLDSSLYVLICAPQLHVAVYLILMIFSF